MPRDATAYRRVLAGLLPQGAAWRRDPDATLTRLLWALADPLARVDSRADDLITEADPRTTAEMLTDWERVVGEPDACAGPAEGIVLRRQRVHAKWTARGGQSRAFFAALADSLGYQIEITEYRPFVCGRSQLGADRLMGDASVRYVWRIAVLGPRVTWWRCGQAEVGVDPMARIDRAEDLECAVHRAAPAHTHLIVGYPDPSSLTAEDGRLLAAEDGRILTTE